MCSLLHLAVGPCISSRACSACYTSHGVTDCPCAFWVPADGLTPLLHAFDVTCTDLRCLAVKWTMSVILRSACCKAVREMCIGLL